MSQSRPSRSTSRRPRWDPVRAAPRPAARTGRTEPLGAFAPVEYDQRRRPHCVRGMTQRRRQHRYALSWTRAVIKGESMFGWLGRFVVRRAWWVIAGWLVASAAIIGLSP